MSRANPFGDLDDFTADPAPKPVAAAAIEQIAQAAGFPSRKAGTGTADVRNKGHVGQSTAPPRRTPRRRTTGRNQQINIKATEETIEQLYRIADDLNLPLGAVLERALAALDTDGKR
jgi:hypothetical protein